MKLYVVVGCASLGGLQVHGAWLSEARASQELPVLEASNTALEYIVEETDLRGAPPGVVREIPKQVEREAVVRAANQMLIDAMSELEQSDEGAVMIAAQKALEAAAKKLGIKLGAKW